MTYTRNCPGWSDQIGLFFHVFGHNTVNSMHLHILDMSVIGPTFWFYEYKNLPVDAVLKVLREEIAAKLDGPATIAEATAAACTAAKAASEVINLMSMRESM